jgi:hypothetical protein
LLLLECEEAQLDQLRMDRHTAPTALRFDPLAVPRLDGEIGHVVFLAHVCHSQLSQLFGACPGVERQLREPMIGVAPALRPEDYLEILGAVRKPLALVIVRRLHRNLLRRVPTV